MKNLLNHRNSLELESLILAEKQKAIWQNDLMAKLLKNYVLLSMTLAKIILP